MPPDDITLMYAAAKGISRSRPVDLSLELFRGTMRKPPITNKGRKTKISRGKIPNVNATNPARIEIGKVNRAIKNINEM
jgi:hypothetical protein